MDKAPSQPLPTFRSLEKWLSTPSASKDNLEETLMAALTRFASLVTNPVLCNPITRKQLSPAEFIMIGYLISSVGATTADKDLSAAIGELRDSVRAAHTDIRTNNAVFKTMFSFVNDFRNRLIPEAPRGLKRKRSLNDANIVMPSPSSTMALVSSKTIRDPLAIVAEAKRLAEKHYQGTPNKHSRDHSLEIRSSRTNLCCVFSPNRVVLQPGLLSPPPWLFLFILSLRSTNTHHLLSSSLSICRLCLKCLQTIQFFVIATLVHNRFRPHCSFKKPIFTLSISSGTLNPLSDNDIILPINSRPSH